jgi:hypothetical protein
VKKQNQNPSQSLDFNHFLCGKMLESVYLTSAEKREFLLGLTKELMVAREKQIEIIAKEKLKAFEREREKAKLIIRQFPGAEAPKKESFITGMEKIDALLRDPKIRMIECSDGSIKISEGEGTKETGFRLSEAEAQKVIKKFSEKSRTPVTDILLKASYAGLTMDAIASKIIGSRFLIIKSQEG